MNKITLWLLVLFGSFQMNAQQLWEIESCSVLASSIYGPMNSVATANATNRMAVIYPASQLTGIAGQTLTKMYFERTGTAAMLGSPNFKIYLKEVTESEWPTGSLDWATATTGAVLVYDSNPVASVGSTAGWKPFTFSTNFVYTGLQNLAVFYEYTNPVASNAITWSYEYGSPCISTANSNTSRYTNNTTGLLPTSLATTNYRRPLIGFDYVVACPKPVNLVVSNVTATAADLSWAVGGTETEWEYGVSPAGTGVPSAPITVSSTSLTNLILTPGTTYTIYVRSNCGASGTSVWAASDSFTTLCVDATSIMENFDTYTTGSTSPMPNCWSKLGNGTCYINTGSVLPSSAPNRLYMIGNATLSTPTMALAILPAVSNLEANTHRLKFKAYATTANKVIEVGYITDVLNSASFVLLETINLPSTTATTAEEFIVTPTNIPAGNKNLAFRNAGIGGSTTTYIDDVIWEPSPSCLDVSNVVFSDVNDTQITVNWTVGGTETAWQYVYGDETVTDPSTLIPNDVTITPSQSISGLTSSTVYKVWIRSNCGTGGFGAWIGPYLMRTLCTPVSAFSQNFDAAATGAILPDCFTKIGNGTATVNTGGVLPGSAPNRLYIFANAGATTPSEMNVFLPPVNNLSVNTHRLKFKAYASTASKSFEVGYQSNLLNPATYVMLETIYLPGTTASEALEFTVIPSGVPAGVENLVFKNPGTGSVAMYVDDILWEAIPTCSDVTALSYSSINDTEVTLNWIAGGTETAWQYVSGASTVIDPSTLTPIDVTGGSTVSISGLTASTTYKIWVRSNCGSGGAGAWIGPLTLTTLCPAVSLFSENFDTSQTGSTNPMAACWDRAGNGSTYTTTGAVAPLSPANRLYTYASSTASSVSLALMPPVNNLQAETHRLRFKAHATAANRSLEIGYLGSPSDLSTFVTLETVANLPSTVATSQEYISIPLDVPVGINRLAFRNMPTDGTATIYIDDVFWEVIPACADVSELKAGNALSTSVEIYWLPGDSETTWQYVYGLSTVTDPNTLTPVDITDNPETTISGLTPNTTYKVWVRSNCGLGDLGVWSEVLTIATTCTPVTDFSENFEASATGSSASMPTCWTKFGTTGSVYPQTGSVAPATPPNRLYMYSSATATAIAVMPPVSNLQAETHRLRFKAYATVLNKTFEVGYFENSSDIASFVSLETFTTSTTTAATIADFVLIPSGVPAGVESLVLRILGANSGATTFYADDFVWETIPLCGDVSNLALTNLTNNSTGLQWTPGDSETAWQYVYGVSTDTDPTTLTPVNVTGTPTGSISNLTPNTVYKYWVRSNCGSGSYGNWSQPFTFVTSCDPVAVFSESFDTYATGVTTPMPDCWRRAGSASTYITTGGVTPGTAPNRLYMTATGSGTNPTQGFAIMPPVSNLSDETHRLRFKAYASAANRYLEIGFFGDIADITTFILLETVDLPSTTAATAQEFIVNIEDVPAGITSLVFRNGGIATGATTLYIDDVFWEAIPTAAPSCVVATVEPSIVCGNFANVITWPSAAGTAEGYNLTVGTTPGGTDIMNNISVGNVNTYSFIGNANTTYYYTVIPFNISGVATGCLEQSFTTIATGCYCTSNPTTNSSLGITNVLLDTTNFPTGDVTYLDHTGTAVNLAQGVNANTKVSFSTTTSYHVNIWIDFNNNFNFESNELVFQGESLSTTPAVFNASFVMPVNAALGMHRMRIGTADTGQATPNSCYSGTSGVTLDFNVNIVPAPSCLPPLTPSIDDVSTTTATLNWLASSSAPTNGYQYYISTTNISPTVSTVPTGSTGPGIITTNLTELTPSTIYFVWMRSVCGTDDFSEWISAISFATSCAPVDLSTAAWTEGFEGLTISGATHFPPCWSKENGDWRSAINSTTTYDTDARTGTYFIQNAFSATNEFIWTPGFALTAGQDYDFSFWYSSYGTYSTWDASVFVNTIQSSTGATEVNEFIASGTVAPTAYTEVVSTFTPTTTGTYYFAIRVNATSSPWYLSFDDFKMTSQDLSNPDFAPSILKVHPNPVRDILNFSYTENITSVEVFNMLGQQVMVNSVNATQGRIDMSDLAAGTYLVKLTANNQQETIKVIKQ